MLFSINVFVTDRGAMRAWGAILPSTRIFVPRLFGLEEFITNKQTIYDYKCARPTHILLVDRHPTSRQTSN